MAPASSAGCGPCTRTSRSVQSKGTDLNNKVQWRQGCQDSGLVLGCHARVESLRRPARGSSFVSTPPPAQGETSRPPAHVPTPRAVDSVIPVSGVLSVRAASSMLCALRMPRVAVWGPVLAGPWLVEWRNPYIQYKLTPSSIQTSSVASRPLTPGASRTSARHHAHRDLRPP